MKKTEKKLLAEYISAYLLLSISKLNCPKENKEKALKKINVGEIEFALHEKQRTLPNEAEDNDFFFQAPETRATVSYILKADFVNELFGILTHTAVTEFYHYTSLDAAQKLLEKKTLRFSSINGLNDRTERRFKEDYSGKRILVRNHFKRIESSNSRFVFSASTRIDDLNQWRLYGADGGGACIIIRPNSYGSPEAFINFFTQNKQRFYIGKVLYSDHFIKDIKAMHIQIRRKFKKRFVMQNMAIWHHFIKQTDYAPEEEVRVFALIKSEGIKREWFLNRYGILNPYCDFKLSQLAFDISGLMLGPKVPESDVNSNQWRLYAYDHGFRKLRISLSSKTHYR